MFLRSGEGSPGKAQQGVRGMPELLTEFERGVLNYLVAYLRRHTYQPSVREIGAEFGIRSTKTVSELLHTLEAKGYLERDPSRSRGVRILGVDLNPDALSVPLLSSVPALGESRSVRELGTPLTVDRRMAGGEGVYFVEAGRGLESLGLREGDHLLVEPCSPDQIIDGELAAVSLHGQGGFARFVREAGVAYLHGPLLGEHPVVLEDPARAPIVGRVVALYRMLRAEQALVQTSSPLDVTPLTH